MKQDIRDMEDVRRLVDRFYEKVKADPVISHLFEKVDWEIHLPVMYRFWENALFFTGTYQGNPMSVHERLHERSPMTEGHFEAWLGHFNSTLDELFEGERKELAQQRAMSISTIMKIRIIHRPS